LKTTKNILAALLVTPLLANSEMQSIEDAEMSELAGRDGLSVAMELRVTGSWAYFQERDGETNSVSLSNFALNGEGVAREGVSPGLVWTQIDVKNDSSGTPVLAVFLPQLTFSVGVQDYEMRRGIGVDGSAANVSRFGSVHLKNFDMSKSYFEFSGHK
jgi:hypothetical protein